MHASGLGLQITRYYSALGEPVPVQHIYRKYCIYYTCHV